MAMLRKRANSARLRSLDGMRADFRQPYTFFNAPVLSPKRSAFTPICSKSVR
jgi:hypothetical protein